MYAIAVVENNYCESRKSLFIFLIDTVTIICKNFWLTQETINQLQQIRKNPLTKSYSIHIWIEYILLIKTDMVNMLEARTAVFPQGFTTEWFSTISS